MTAADIIAWAALIAAFAAAAVRARDRFWLLATVALVAVAAYLLGRAGLQTAHLFANLDDVVMTAGAVLLAAMVLLSAGLPRPVEDRLLLGESAAEWAFDRSLVAARQPFIDAARARDPSVHDRARWRPLLTVSSPTPQWAELADRLAHGDTEWAEQARSETPQYEWLPWAARTDQIAAEWARLRDPLVARRRRGERILRRLGSAAAIASALCIVAANFNVATGVASEPPVGRAPIVPEQPAGRSMALVPYGGEPASELLALADFYRMRYQLTVEVLPPLSVPEDWRDPTRHQFAGEDLLARLRGTFPNAVAENRIIVGVLPADIFVREIPEWRWAFGSRADDNFAVVSTYRMRAAAGPFGDRLEASRLRKMLTRTIGFMYYELGPSFDQRSVMYLELQGIPDLDAMGENY